LTALGDREDGPPHERSALATPVRIVDDQEDRPTTKPPEPYEHRTALGELGPIRVAVQGIQETLERIELKVDRQGREAGTAKSVQSALALQVARLEAGGLRPNGLTGKRILIVEDEDVLLDLCERVLSELGAVVMGASSRIEAETILATLRRPIDLALVDLHLPANCGGVEASAQGVELLRWISRVHPSVRVIVMSGLFDGVTELDRFPVARLEKMFTLDELKAAVYSALGMGDTLADTERPPAPPPNSLPDYDPDEPDTSNETPVAKRPTNAPEAASPARPATPE
jgi:CheY-like chemotaxis protein